MCRVFVPVTRRERERHGDGGAATWQAVVLDLVGEGGDDRPAEAGPRRVVAARHAGAVIANLDVDPARVGQDRHRDGHRAGLGAIGEGVEHRVAHGLGHRESHVRDATVGDRVRRGEVRGRATRDGDVLGQGRQCPVAATGTPRTAGSPAEDRGLLRTAVWFGADDPASSAA